MDTVIATKKRVLLKGRGQDSIIGSKILGIMVALCIIAMILLLPQLLLAAPGDILTVAGGGTAIITSGTPTSTILRHPNSVAVDSAGNMFIADTDHDLIKMVDTSGVVTTVAGNGTYGYSGDNGPATSASLSGPTGVAVDFWGNIYIADQGNNRIRMVEKTSGNISTIAGNGTAGYFGDNGLATSAMLNYPAGIAVDSAGRIYIADYGNHRIRMVWGNMIYLVAGSGIQGYSGDNNLVGMPTDARLNHPTGVAIVSTGGAVDYLYIADSGNNCIREVLRNWNGGWVPIYTVVGSLNGPAGVAVDSVGNLYIADTGNNLIQKRNTNGVITTVAGSGTAGYSGDNGQATSATLNRPTGVAVDSANNIYIADYNNNLIRKVNTSGVITTAAGGEIPGTPGSIDIGDNGPATAAYLNTPVDVAVDSAGNMYIADIFNYRIRKVNTSGIITTVAGNGTAGYLGDGGPATSGSLHTPAGVAIDSAGNLYIADYGNSRIRKVDTGGFITTVVGNGTADYSGDNGPATLASLNGPMDIAIDSAGNIYIADSANGRIRKVDTSGMITTVAGNGTFMGVLGDNGPATSACLNFPYGITVDSAGNIYAATGLNRIRKVIETIKPTGSLLINGGASTVNAPDVTLTLTCTDVGGSCAQMQFSNDNVTYSTPNAYSATESWTLNSGGGSKTVYSKFKDLAGNWSDPVSASVILAIDTTPPITTATPAGGTYASAQSVTLSCDDGGGSGCAYTYYCFGASCSPTTPYTGPIMINSSSSLRFYSIDTSINLEVVKTATYTIQNPLSYTITATAGTGGGITPSGVLSVNAGSNANFTSTPYAGYRLNELFIDGVKQQSPRNPYPFYNVTADHTISVTFTQDVYTITASVANADNSVPAHGNMTPSGTLTANKGDNVTFTINPDAGCQVSSIIDNGVAKGAPSPYLLTNIAADHTITVYLKTTTYTITATAGPGGTISPPGVTTLNWGGNQTYTITPTAGYHVDNVLVDGVPVGAVSTYPFTTVTQNHTISATFAPNPTYTITTSVVGNGTISPSGNVSVNTGANQKFTITPAAGYRVADVLVDESSVGARTSYTFYSVQTNHSIRVSFVSDVYSVNLTVAAGGSATVTGTSITSTTVTGGTSSPFTVNPGDSVTFTITPDPGRSVRSLVDNGSYKYNITTYTLTNIRKDHTINVSIK